MYRFTRASRGVEGMPDVSDSGAAPEDCFGEKARVWIPVIILGALIILAASSAPLMQRIRARRGQGPGGGILRRISGSGPHAGGEPQLQPAAFRQCPYCPGMLDAQGRCNVPGCPLYSPAYGTPAAPAPPTGDWTGGGPVLIKPLAMEVLDAPGMDGAEISAVYAGGWADKAGLMQGDVLVGFDGKPVAGADSLQALVAAARAEAPARADFLRDGFLYGADVTVGEGEMEGAAKPVNWGNYPWVMLWR